MDLFNVSFLRFGVVGVAATVIHVVVFIALVELVAVSPVISSIPAFLLAMLASYAANYRWTFEATGPHSFHLPRYTVVALTGLCLNVAITHTVVNLLGYLYGLALALVIVVIPIVTFFLNRTWTYQAT